MLYSVPYPYTYKQKYERKYYYRVIDESAVEVKWFSITAVQ